MTCPSCGQSFNREARRGPSAGFCSVACHRKDERRLSIGRCWLLAARHADEDVRWEAQRGAVCAARQAEERAERARQRAREILGVDYASQLDQLPPAAPRVSFVTLVTDAGQTTYRELEPIEREEVNDRRTDLGRQENRATREYDSGGGAQ